MTVTPAHNATDVRCPRRSGCGPTAARSPGVTLVDATGVAVAGKMRDDGGSWVPDQPLL